VLSASFNGWFPTRAFHHRKTGPVDRLVTVTDNKRVTIWDLAAHIDTAVIDASAVRSDTCRGPALAKRVVLGDPVDARFSPDERVIIVRDHSGNLAMFEANSGKCLDLYADPTRHSAAISPDGEFVGVASESGEIRTVRVPDWETLALAGSHTPPPAAEISRLPADTGGLSGGILGVDCGGGLLVVDPATKTNVLDITTGQWLSMSANVQVVSFNCANRFAAKSGSQAQVWSSEGPVKRNSLRVGSFEALALNRAGTRLVTGSRDSVSIWSLDRRPPPVNATWEDLMTYFRSNTRACLTSEDRKKYLGEVTVVAERKAATCEAGLRRQGPSQP